MITAARSETGGCRRVIAEAEEKGHELISTPYCFKEVENNLTTPEHRSAWANEIKPRVALEPDCVVYPYPLPEVTDKDRPVLKGALAAEADCLLTMDKPFQAETSGDVYGVAVLDAGGFLRNEHLLQERAEQKKQLVLEQAEKLGNPVEKAEETPKEMLVEHQEQENIKP